ncbi:MAG: copper-binding protein [Acidobacteriia bacterium]|nr:copper-binding protein [Terriglobia bacterium]
MRRVYKLASVWAVSIFITVACFGQSAPGKKSYTFHGKIEGVDESSKSLKVNGEAVPGWMSAMTMDYKVDDTTVLKKVKPGDRITATVYDGDLVLHKVQVAPKQPDTPKSAK